MFKICVAAAFVCVAVPALAHDHKRPELDGYFRSLRNTDGAYCCDGTDAISVDDPDWKTENGHNSVKIDGAWVSVPNSALVTQPNKYGPAVVWPGPTVNGEQTVRCFMQGMMG